MKDLLEEACRRHGVVGASLAVWERGDVSVASHGVADIRTARPVTDETLFLIGSTTKVYTATLVMQLVSGGEIGLDDFVADVLPEANFRSSSAAASTTIRHLLSHTSGIGLGPYADHGRGDDAVSSYIAAALPSIDPVSAPGDRFGYSNTGIVVLGRIVEVMLGKSWDEAVRERILEPGDLRQTATLPEDVILRPHALGHVAGGDGPEVAPVWGVAGRSMGPTGSTLACSAADLVRFGAIHLDSDAEDRLSLGPWRAAMHHPQVDVPRPIQIADRWCLGWYTQDWGGVRMVGHTGHNIGAGSHLAVFPDDDTAFAIVFNSPGDAGMVHDVFGALGRERLGATVRDPWVTVDPAPPRPVDVFAGTYTSDVFSLTFSARDGRLWLDDATGTAAPAVSAGAVPLLRGDDRSFGVASAGTYTVAPPDGSVAPLFVFDGDDAGGVPGYVYNVVFAARRVR